MRAHDWSTSSLGRRGPLAAVAAHRRPPDAQHRPPDVHLVGPGARLPLQRRLPPVDRPGAPSGIARPAGARGVGRDLGHHRPADRAGDVGRRRDLARGPAGADHAPRRARGRLLDLQLQPDRRRERAGRHRRRAGRLHRDDAAGPRARASSAAERDRWPQLFEQAPIFMALLRRPEHRFAIANPPTCSSSAIGRSSARPSPKRCPRRRGRATSPCSTACSRAARRTAPTARSYEVRPTPDGPREERFLDFVYQPIKDAAGAVTGIFVLGADVTLRTQAHHALRESEASFRSALKAGRIGIVGADYPYADRIWSEEGMELFGLTLVDGRGRLGGRDDEFVGGASPGRPPPGRALPRARPASRRLHGRLPRRPARRIDRSGCPAAAVAARGADGQPQRLISVMADVTEAKQVRRKLRVERERLRLALSAGRMGALRARHPAPIALVVARDYSLFGVSPATLHADARERPRSARSGGPARYSSSAARTPSPTPAVPRRVPHPAPRRQQGLDRLPRPGRVRRRRTAACAPSAS